MTFATKDQARASSSRARSELSADDLHRAALGIASHSWSDLVGFGPVTCYISMDDEPGTSELRSTLNNLGIAVYLPIMAPQRKLLWGFDGSDLVQNTYGILEPAPADIDLANCSAMIIPGLRMGRDGTRLGRGAGYYDRVLNSVPRHSAGGPLRIGIVFDNELDDSVPAEAHDSALDVIVTPALIHYVIS